MEGRQGGTCNLWCSDRPEGRVVECLSAIDDEHGNQLWDRICWVAFRRSLLRLSLALRGKRHRGEHRRPCTRTGTRRKHPDERRISGKNIRRLSVRGYRRAFLEERDETPPHLPANQRAKWFTTRISDREERRRLREATRGLSVAGHRRSQRRRTRASRMLLAAHTHIIRSRP